jgi:hypothetical protein
VLWCIARGLPLGYATDGIRALMIQGVFDTHLLISSLLLASGYFVAALMLFFYQFKRSTKNGLLQLTY